MTRRWPVPVKGAANASFRPTSSPGAYIELDDGLGDAAVACEVQARFLRRLAPTCRS